MDTNSLPRVSPKAKRRCMFHNPKVVGAAASPDRLQLEAALALLKDEMAASVDSMTVRGGLTLSLPCPHFARILPRAPNQFYKFSNFHKGSWN